MKIPGLSKSLPKPDRTIAYQVVGGFNASTPTVPSWSPKLGSTIRGDSPLLAYMFSIGGAKFFLPADADSVEVAQAYSAVTFGTEVTPTPDLSIRTPGPVLHPLISTRPLQVGEGIVPTGSLAAPGSALTVRFPDAFVPAPEGYTS